MTQRRAPEGADEVDAHTAMSGNGTRPRGATARVAAKAARAAAKAARVAAGKREELAEPDREIPEATVERLAVYLRALTELAAKRTTTVSSEALANAAGVNSAKLRKDLSHLGSYGTRGVGYEVDLLVEQLSRVLGLNTNRSVALVGVGNLGHALAGYGGFGSRGFEVVALFDADPRRVGEVIAGIEVSGMAELDAVVRAKEVSVGVIATPAEAAQEVCDQLVDAGVTSILNFAPAVLTVPDSVDVRKVDLALELQILAFHAERRGTVTP